MHTRAARTSLHIIYIHSKARRFLPPFESNRARVATLAIRDPHARAHITFTRAHI